MNFQGQNYQSTNSPTLSASAWSRLKWWHGLLGVIAILVFFLLYQRIFVVKTITVTGLAETTVEAAQAEITFLYLEQGVNRLAVSEQGKTQFQALLDAVRSQNPSNVKVSNSQLTPTGSDLRSNFQFSQGAAVTVTPQAVASIVSLVEQRNGIVAEIRYLPQDEEATSDELSRLALQKARQEASVLANSGGLILGGTLSVIQLGSEVDAGTTTQTSLETGNQLTLSKAVEVTFRAY